VPKEQLYKTVQGILDEIGYNRQLPVIRWLGLLLLKVLKKTCNGLYVNESGINRVSVRLEVFMAVIMRNVVFWDIKPQFVLHRRHITSPLQSPAS
jgi:hypothetical protein